MSGGVVSAAQLLKMDDGEFNHSIKDMSVKKLLETISILQKEMGKEQENFNSLTAELGNLKKNSGQYKSVSKDMAASQKRLTVLMDRSMQCFSKQGQQQDKESTSSDAHEKSAPQTRNSKELPKKKTDPPSINPFVEVNSADVEDQPASNTSKPEVTTTRLSFAEAKNVFNGSSQNGTTTSQANSYVSLHDKRPKSMASTNSSKTFMDDVSNGTVMDSRPKSDIEVVKPSSVTKSSAFDNKANSTVSTKNVNSASKTTLGPLASQNNKFLSKSTDNVGKLSNDLVDGNDIVKGKVANSKPKIVMTADRQYLDLDSFTDRKNLLSELKSFDKELKHVAKTDPLTKDHAAQEPKLVRSFGMGSALKEDKNTAQKASLLSDIKLAKKPSAVKNGDVENQSDKLVVKTKSNITHPKTEQSSTEKTGKVESLKAINDREIVDVVKGVNKQIMKNNTTEAVVSEITIMDQKESPAVSSQSEDGESQSSDLSEDEDKFVTEFSFPQKGQTSRSDANTVVKPGRCFLPLIFSSHFQDDNL